MEMIKQFMIITYCHENIMNNLSIKDNGFPLKIVQNFPKVNSIASELRKS